MPASSQKIFTITQMQNKELDGLSGKEGKRGRKIVLPGAVLDKYQIVREKQEVANPCELNAKKFTSCCFGDETKGKNVVRFKFDSSVKLNKRSRSNLVMGV